MEKMNIENETENTEVSRETATELANEKIQGEKKEGAIVETLIQKQIREAKEGKAAELKKVKEAGLKAKIVHMIKKSDEEKRLAERIKGLEAINGNSSKRMMYNKWMKENPEIAEKYIEAIASDPKTMYWKYDSEQGKFVHAGSFGIPMGETGKYE